MPLFQRKTEIKEAVKWTGTNEQELVSFAGTFVSIGVPDGVRPPTAVVYTPSGPADVQPGDWIAKQSSDDFYAIVGETFAKLYEPVDSAGMSFGAALDALKAGKRVARSGWNGKDMWIALSPGVNDLPAEKFWAGPNREYAQSQGGFATVLPCITMKTANGPILMGWLASQTDMLSSDWEIV